MQKKIIAFILLILMAGPGLTGCAEETPTITPTATRISRMEIVTATPLTPTDTPTSTPTETPTLTFTPLPPTDIPTSTPTFDPLLTITPTTAVVEMPKITALSDTNCRKNPDKESKVLGFFVQGQTAEVKAKDKYGIWFLIANPTVDYEPNCWVWSGNVNITGDLNAVSVYTVK